MQTQLAGAMVKAELEASQKLVSVIPYQTGQVISRPNIGRRNHIDRHSFALGDTQEYDRLLRPAGDFLSPRYTDPQRLQQQRNIFEPSTRPKSVIEGDLSSIFKNDWSFGLVSHGSMTNSRPKSADISNWSFNPSKSSKNLVREDTSPWTTPVPKFDQQWSNRSSVIIGEGRTDELQSPPVVLSMYDDKNTLFTDQYSPSLTNKFNTSQNQYGQFLNPPIDENGYFSDHSDNSNRSNGSKNKFNVFRSKEKKNLDVVNMQLLEGIMAICD